MGLIIRPWWSRRSCLWTRSANSYNGVGLTSRRRHMSPAVGPLSVAVMSLPIVFRRVAQNEMRVVMNTKANQSNENAPGQPIRQADFWRRKTLEELASEQGVMPLADPESLTADF